MDKKTILIIEDEAAILYALKARLTVEGYRLFTSDNAEEGLKILSKYTPDLIVLDVLLPKMSGLEFLGQIKKNEKTKTIPAIIISNLNKKEDVDRGYQLGAQDYIIKSEVSLEKIMDKIKEALGNA